MTDCIPKKLLATRDDIIRMGIQVSNSTLLRWELQGRFPRRIRMGATSVAWPLAEILAWIDARTAEREHIHYAEF